MPADRITSASPWHVVLIIDDSGSMSGKPAADINDGLRAMVSEMEVRAKGTKPYFKISIVAFGSHADVITEAKGERDVDVNAIATFAGTRGGTRCSEGFNAAADILTRNPGAQTDFRPYVFFFSDGRPDSDDEQPALKAAGNLKSLAIAAGQPVVWSLGYGDIDHNFMKQVASNIEFFKELPGSTALTHLFPAIGTIAGTKTGENAINAAILNL